MDIPAVPDDYMREPFLWLYRFLTTGRLGVLRRNMHLKEVLDLRGLPDGYRSVTSRYGRKLARFLETVRERRDNVQNPDLSGHAEYGNLLLCFGNSAEPLECEVVVINLYIAKPTLPEWVPPELGPDAFEHLIPLDSTRLLRYLRARKVPCRRIIDSLSHENLDLQLFIPGSRVQISIDLEEGEDRIWSIGCNSIWPQVEERFVLEDCPEVDSK